MSIDGTGILESDFAHDVYNEILDLYDAGSDFQEIREQISTYEDSLDDALDLEIYLTAQAKAYWEIGLLPPDLLEQVQKLIESEKSLQMWRQIGGEEDYAVRRRVLHRFLKQIMTPRKKPRPRKKYAKIEKKLFQIGDCLLLRDGEDIHKGVVCQINEYRGHCDYAILVLERSTAPNLASFLKANFVGRRIPSTFHEKGFIYCPAVLWPEHKMILREGVAFEVIGRIDLDPSQYVPGSYTGVLSKKDVLAEFRRIYEDREVFGEQLLPLTELMKRGPNEC